MAMWRLMRQPLMGSDGQSSGGCFEPGRHPDERLGRLRRLVKSRQFQEAYDQGQCRHGRLMALWLRRAPDANLRLGVVASRRVGNAVQRNRAKRLLREVYRRRRSGFYGPFDVVLVARRAILSASAAAAGEELERLAAAAGLSPRRPSEARREPQVSRKKK